MTLLAAALEFLSAGVTVIPIKLDGTKSPATAKWREFHQRPPTDDEIRKLFAKPSGLAILGGQTSGNLTIIDFDRPGAFDAWRELLEGMYPGMLEHLPVVATPGGHHVYLRAETCLGNTKLAKSISPYVKDGKESFTVIETRGQGGYVLAPPSPAAVHPTGIEYKHVSGPPLTQIPVISDDWYNALMNAARAFNEAAKPAKEERQTAKPSKPGEGAKPGEDFDARASWFEVLEPHGWESIRTIGDKTYWRRPGKKDGGISATTGHCGSKLYVFSSNAAPFEAERAYNKFSAYGLLNCGGDYATAARELRAKGYGAVRASMGRSTPAPTNSKWDELRQSLDPQQAPHPADDAPPITDRDAPIEGGHAPMTADEIDRELDNDKGAALSEPNFSRLLAARADDAEWQRIVFTLTRHKAIKLFNEKIKNQAKKRSQRPGDWREELLYRENKDGELVLENCLTNYVAVITNDSAWTGVLAFDEFSNQIVTRRPPPFKRQRGQWGDADALEAKVWVEQAYRLKPNLATMCEAILVVAKRSAYNALQEYLDKLQCRDVETLDTWLIDFFGCPDTPYTRAVGAKWLISAVARAYEPGCKVDTVLILEGKQGLKKSRAIEQLCPNLEWFTDGLSDFGSKSQAEEVEGKWIIELGELKGFGREIEQIKAFVTRRAENYRPAYARYSVHSPRKCVFAGTVNPGAGGYLRDETGNRRFWPVECTKQAPEMTPAIRDQLWAEAKARYQAGEKWWLEEETLQLAATAEQEKRVYIDPWHELIESAIRGETTTSVDEVLGHLGIEKGKRGTAESMRAARVLMALKWVRYQQRWPDMRRTWRYRNPNQDHMLIPDKGNGLDHESQFA